MKKTQAPQVKADEEEKDEVEEEEDDDDEDGGEETAAAETETALGVRVDRGQQAAAAAAALDPAFLDTPLQWLGAQQHQAPRTDTHAAESQPSVADIQAMAAVKLRRRGHGHKGRGGPKANSNRSKDRDARRLKAEVAAWR